MTYAITADAYCKVVLHAAKYVTCAVHGVLLGRMLDDVVQVVDALPIAHSSLAAGTSTLTQIAVMMASAHAELKDLSLVGTYYAPEIADDTDIPRMPTRIADLIREEQGNRACLIYLDAACLSAERRQLTHCFILYVLDEKSDRTPWVSGRRPAQDLHVDTRTLALCNRALSSAACVHSTSDFEDHCLDLGRDWLNMELLNTIESL
jgi:ER membrane protein complex subunit 8/9